MNMTVETFVALLTVSAVATSLAIEIAKDFLNKMGIIYNSQNVAILFAFIIGIVEVIINALGTNTPITYGIVGYCITMGIINVVAAQVSYDKVIKLIFALFNKNE